MVRVHDDRCPAMFAFVAPGASIIRPDRRLFQTRIVYPQPQSVGEKRMLARGVDDNPRCNFMELAVSRSHTNAFCLIAVQQNIHHRALEEEMHLWRYGGRDQADVERDDTQSLFKILGDEDNQ